MREDNFFKKEMEHKKLSDLGHVIIKNSAETVDMAMGQIRAAEEAAPQAPEQIMQAFMQQRGPRGPQ